MKKILIINTGGTLSGAKDGQNSWLSPSLQGSDILEFLPGPFENIKIESEDFSSEDSANIFPADWAQLAERVTDAQENYRGIVLIHGTDTLAYTSSMLSFMLRGIPVPLVITGSQLPISYPGNDAARNLSDAIEMAASGIPGVFVVFSGKIILGCRASKVRSRSFNAFESINYPEIGTIDSDGIHINSDALPGAGQKTRNFTPEFSYSDKVFLLKLYPGISPDIMEWLVNSGYRGVYIEAFGLGGIPFKTSAGLKDFLSALKAASDKGLTILAGTQCLIEGCDLSVYETGIRALAAGAAEAKDMTTEAALTKLMWVLGKTDNPEKIKLYLSRNLAGEISSHME